MRTLPDDRIHWDPPPGGFSQAEDELTLHALQRLGEAMPHRSESEIAERMLAMTWSRERAGTHRPRVAGRWTKSV